MTMELILTLPLLFIVLLGLLEFSILFFARGNVVEASRVGARHASLRGASQESVEFAVRQILSPAYAGQSQVSVQFGQSTGDLVAVDVHVPMSRAAPDLLWPIGFSLDGRELIGSTRMLME